MTKRTSRRSVLGAVAVVTTFAGCVGDINENPDDENDSADTGGTDDSDDGDDSDDVDGAADETDGNDDRAENEEDSTDDDEEDSTDDDEEDSTDDDEELTEEEIVALVESVLEDDGIETETIDLTDGVLEIVYFPTGTSGEAVRTEIDIIADVYVRAYNTGLETDRMEAFVRDPDDGSIMNSFVIETEWAADYSNDEIGWEEYIERISETFE